MSGSVSVVAFEGQLNAIVKEYLDFVGFARTENLFARECQERGKPIANAEGRAKADTKLLEIQNSMLDYFTKGQRRGYFELWNEFLPTSVRDSDSVAQKLEFYLNIYFATYPARDGSQDRDETDAAMMEFRSFLETRGSSLSQTTEFLPFYALPFVPNPKTHPSYKELFTEVWVTDLRMRLEKFLTLALKSSPQPRLFQLYEGGGGGAEAQLQAMQLQQRLVDSERKTITYVKRHNRVQADYHNLIGITADLVDALEATIQGKPITPEDLQIICARLFNNHMRQQSVDLTRPGTAGDVLRASVMPSQHGAKEMGDPFPALEYDKLKQDLANGSDRLRGLLLQALRWRLTRSSAGDQRDGIMSAYIHNDLLGCTQAGQHRETILNFLKSGDPLSKQYTARLLNAFASICSGRAYLAHNPELLPTLMVNLRGGDNEALTNENVLGALQKLSLRRNLQTSMIEEGVIEWLVGVLEDNDALSDYTLEYSVALLMNLCLRTSGKKKCASIAHQTLKVLSDLLGHDNQEIRPYVNGALYSILAIPLIREEAVAMGMEEILKCFVKDDQPDMNRQIEFIIKQLNSNEQVDDAESDDEDDDEDEEDQDAMEADLDKDELLKAQANELCGEKLLTSEYINSSPGNGRKKRHTDNVELMHEPLKRPVTPGHKKQELFTLPQSRALPGNGSRPGSRVGTPGISRPASRDAMARPPTRSGSRPATQEGLPKDRPRSRPGTQGSQAANSLSRPTSQSSKQGQPAKKNMDNLGSGGNVKEYESAFGSRPKIPRTPDLSGIRPTSRGSIGEAPQPKYSESGPRPSSAGKTSAPGTPRKASTGSTAGNRP